MVYRCNEVNLGFLATGGLVTLLARNCHFAFLLDIALPSAECFLDGFRGICFFCTLLIFTDCKYIKSIVKWDLIIFWGGCGGLFVLLYPFVGAGVKQFLLISYDFLSSQTNFVGGLFSGLIVML